MMPLYLYPYIKILTYPLDTMIRKTNGFISYKFAINV